MKKQLVIKLVTNQNIKTTKQSVVKEENGNYTILNEYVKSDKIIKGKINIKASGIVYTEDTEFNS